VGWADNRGWPLHRTGGPEKGHCWASGRISPATRQWRKTMPLIGIGHIARVFKRWHGRLYTSRLYTNTTEGVDERTLDGCILAALVYKQALDGRPPTTLGNNCTPKVDCCMAIIVHYTIRGYIMEVKRGRGRPVSDNPKRYKVQVRLTQQQRDHFRGVASGSGMGLSDWIRWTLERGARFN
jgi:hypothetical protein